MNKINIQQYIRENQKAFLLFTSDWNFGAKEMERKIDKVDANVLCVNAESQWYFCKSINIIEVPTLTKFENGKMIKQLHGNQTLKKIQDFIKN